MKGFVYDYSELLQHEHGIKHETNKNELTEIMETYTPEQLPVLSGLARSYAISDNWFSSVPTQTNANRAFSMAGTSKGMVNNSFYDAQTQNRLFNLATLVPSISRMHKTGKYSIPSTDGSNSDALPATRSLFEVLESFNKSWRVYWQECWPPRPHGFEVFGRHQYVRTMFPSLLDRGFDDNFIEFKADSETNAFYKAAQDGTLPAVSWIEPKWGGGESWGSIRLKGNDYHPVCDTTVGEDFVMNVYNALSTGKNWNETLLVITFDEHGGTYDHVPPPRALDSGLDRCPDNKRPGMDETTHSQFGFKFTRFGVRVPTLLVSPRIAESAVFRSGISGIPFDHTSIISTILKMAGIEKQYWNMGNRVENAPTFEDMISENNDNKIAKQPQNALTITTNDHRREALTTNDAYLLVYVGSLWGGRAPPNYVSILSG